MRTSLVLLLLISPCWGQDRAVSELDRFFEKSFQAQVDRSPIRQGYLGIKQDYHRWDDYSDAGATADLALRVTQLDELRRDFLLKDLNTEQRLSYRLFEDQAEMAISAFPWRHHAYGINQMFGLHSQTPSFLINIHKVDNLQDAQAYIARLKGVETLMDQAIEAIQRQERLEITPPKFMFPLVLSDCRNVIRGKPFDEGPQSSTLYGDFVTKVEGLASATAEQRASLLAQGRDALRDYVGPAYARLIAALEHQAQSATSDGGVWRLPRGDAYYRHCLRRITTTNLSAEDIHSIGLAEVARIHGEMEGIKKKVKFEGTLAAFFQFMREDPQFYYENTDTGRQRYMREAKEMIDRMRASLDHMFRIQPKADMIVKRVEAFREKSAGTAFYLPGSPDGSRPGIYYANLYDMKRMPIYQMEALAFHEGIPGHHMQISIAQELTGVPKFRRFSLSYSAYVEGWGLYCELLPKEFGYYRDPYSDFGRLAMELWRAARLVVDTGIHHKRWSRQKAIDYLIANTPDAEDECVRAINRYLVMPGQATAYKIGMLKILELRQTAQEELGDRFDIRDFHDAVLAPGPLPLDLLEEQVLAWIARQSK